MNSTDYLEKLFSLKDRVAIVTGAARGNGRAFADALLQAGATVYLVDILEEDLAHTATTFKTQGLLAHPLLVDLTEVESCTRLVEHIIKTESRIDILVNNAGITLPKHSLDYTEYDWDTTLNLNLKIPFFLSQRVAQFMKQSKLKGSIINVSSLNAEMAFPENPAYVSAKGGLKMMTKALAKDLGEYGIRVNNVGPGYFKTAMTEKSWANVETRAARSKRTILSRWGIPEQDLAGIILFLASDASSYVTAQDFYIDGGWLANGLSP